MKIIQIVGLANSGKTSFINRLIPVLSLKGSVGVIKHLGDHEYFLEGGKDTTDFFNAGAQISVGIDTDKSVMTIRENTLEEILFLLSEQDINFVIVEGYKQRSFPKIVIGDLIIENCILVNPSIEEVINSLPMFEDFNKIREIPE